MIPTKLAKKISRLQTSSSSLIAGDGNLQICFEDTTQTISTILCPLLCPLGGH